MSLWGTRAALFIGGCIFALAVAELGLRAAGAAVRWVETRPGGAADGRIRILCLGESTTAALFPFDTSWPAQLGSILNAGSDGGKFEVINRGRNGTITSAIAERLPWLLDAERPSIVITMMGVNDAAGHAAGRAITARRSDLKIVRVWRWARLELGRRAWLRRREISARAESPADEARRDDACLLACKKELDAVDLGICFPSLKRRAERRPDDWEAQFALGGALWSEGSRARAREAFARSVRVAAKEAPTAHTVIARFLLNAGDWGGFESHWRAAWAARPWDTELLEVRFSQFRALGKDAEATALAREAAARAPARGTGHLLLALLAMRDGHPNATTLREILEACRLEPGNRDFAVRLAQIYAAMGRWEEADERLEPFRTGNSAEFFSRYRNTLPYSTISANRGREDEALKAFRHYLTKEARMRPTLEGVAELLLRAGRSAEAARLYDLLAAENDARFSFEDMASFSTEEGTRARYAQIGRTLRERGVVWIAMQYPLRTLEGLRARTAGFPEAVLVENREDFLAAERLSPAPRLFTDRFAGDFGHCTPEGNRLLAESAARAVHAALDRRR